VLPLIQPK